MTQAETQEPRFELSGGRLCLDFANTLDDRLTGRAKELLHRYTDLLSWSRQAGIVTHDEAQGLLRAAMRRPEHASVELARAITLREAIYRIFSAAAGGRQPGEADLALLNAALAETLARSRLVPTPNGYTWGWSGDEDALDRVIWPVVRSAASVLTSEELTAVRECAAGNCGWLFLDTSRNRSRRWCNMKVCGNRAKARRYYERRLEQR